MNTCAHEVIQLIYYTSMADSDRNIVFYIPHYRSNDNLIILLNHCIRGIKENYPLSDIVICESPSIAEKGPYDISGVLWIENPIPNSACIGCYKDYLERYKDSKKRGIFLHDTMVMRGRFSESLLNLTFGFIWNFNETFQADIVNISMRHDLFNMLNEHDMDFEDYDGCFGWALHGTYESIDMLWRSIPFERYMTLPSRRDVMLDMERFIGATAFCKRLVESSENCSLCGDIFQCGGGFGLTYKGETYDDIKKFPYKDVCVKFWGRRTNDL